MNENSQVEQKDHQVNHCQDEVELFDYLMLIWKWKYFIIAGTITCSIIMLFISLGSHAQKYQISLILKPAIRNIDKSGGEVFIDSPEIMKFLIEGELKYEILEMIKRSNVKGMTNSFNAGITIPRGQNLLYLSYETANDKIGLKKIEFLIKALQEKYTEKISVINKEYEKEIRTKKSKLADLKYRARIKYEKDLQLKKNKLFSYKSEEKVLTKDISNLEERLDAMIKENILVRKNSEKFISDRKSLVNNNDQIDSLRSLILSNITQQNINLSNSIQNQIVNYIFTRNQKEQSLYDIRNQIKNLTNEISELEKSMNNGQSKFILDPTLYNLMKQIEDIEMEIEELDEEKKNIQTIQIIKAPTTSQNLSENKMTTRVIVLSAGVGFFMMIFIAFFAEYFKSYKKRKNIEKANNNAIFP